MPDRAAYAVQSHTSQREERTDGCTHTRTLVHTAAKARTHAVAHSVRYGRNMRSIGCSEEGVKDWCRHSGAGGVVSVVWQGPRCTTVLCMWPDLVGRHSPLQQRQRVNPLQHECNDRLRRRRRTARHFHKAPLRCKPRHAAKLFIEPRATRTAHFGPRVRCRARSQLFRALHYTMWLTPRSRSLRLTPVAYDVSTPRNLRTSLRLMAFVARAQHR